MKGEHNASIYVFTTKDKLMTNKNPCARLLFNDLD